MSFKNYSLLKLNVSQFSLLPYFIVKRTSVFLGSLSLWSIWASKYSKSESVQLSISSLVTCRFCLRTCSISIRIRILKVERLSATLLHPSWKLPLFYLSLQDGFWGCHYILFLEPKNNWSQMSPIQLNF